MPQETTMEVKGRDLVAGLPKTMTLTSQEVREALLETIATIVDSVRVTLERCPPELSADLVDRGLMLAGGGALLRGLDKLLAEETGLPVHIAEDPLSAVAEGTGRALSELKFLRRGRLPTRCGAPRDNSYAPVLSGKSGRDPVEHVMARLRGILTICTRAPIPTVLNS